MRLWCVYKTAHPPHCEPLRRGPRPHRLCFHPLDTVPGGRAGPLGHRKTNQQVHSLKAVRCITVLCTHRAGFPEPGTGLGRGSPAGGSGFWGRKTCWGLACTRTTVALALGQGLAGCISGLRGEAGDPPAFLTLRPHDLILALQPPAGQEALPDSADEEIEGS